MIGKRIKSTLLFLIIIICQLNIIEPSIEFLNDNETFLISVLENEFIRNLIRQDSVYDASGDTTQSSTDITNLFTSTVILTTGTNTLKTMITSTTEVTPMETKATYPPVISIEPTSGYITMEGTTGTHVNTDTMAESTITTRITTVITTESSTSIRITTGTTYKSTTTTSLDSSYCQNRSHLIVGNECRLKNNARRDTVEVLRSNSTNTTTIADGISLYIEAITDTDVPSNESYILNITELDQHIKTLSHNNLTVNTTTSFIMTQELEPNVDRIFGASFIRGTGGQIVKSNNTDVVANSAITTAAVINNPSSTSVTSVSILIIDKPTLYEDGIKSSGKNLASSIIIISIKRINESSIPINISLFFQILPEPQINDNSSNYYCSFYNISTDKWDETGCTSPVRNENSTQYECSCNHTTAFALLRSPKSATTTTIPPFNPQKCNDTNLIELGNGTCVPNSEGAKLAVDILRNPNNTNNSMLIAEELVRYLVSTSNLNTSSTSNTTLTPTEIDNLVGNLTNVTFVGNTTSSFLIAQPPIQDDNNITVLGASFVHNQGGYVVYKGNHSNIINSHISAAAIVNETVLIGVTSLNMLIIDRPSSAYQTNANSSNKTLASSVIVASLRRNTSVNHSIIIYLYFQILPDFKPNNTDVDYYCSFFETLSSQWNESGCTIPHYNATYNRYECSCNHTTSFALIWLPKGPLTRYLDAQDIASLVFQSISILCFLAVITHALFIRLRNSLMSLQAYDLLPLISSASTTLLFIFYIALGMTVYTRTSSSNQTQCFTSSRVLMFIVYFFLIFMFCTKTSVGYFNYLRFVRLFPQPRFLKLVKMLIISFFVSMTWVSFAIGFNSNSSFRITQLYAYKLCWFTRPALYYFLTIPVCIFLLINVILFILIVYRIINHVRYATSPHQTYERMKRCVLVLLSSCLSQGIGWLFGPVLSFVDPTAGEVLGWFFIIFNGLEGLWSILLYGTIRSQRMDEQKRLIAAKELSKSTSTSRIRSKKVSRKHTDKVLVNQAAATYDDITIRWDRLDARFFFDSETLSSSTC